MSGKIVWSSPSNIALIKYWGKLPNQIPMNPSLSITLSESVTITEVDWDYDINRPKIEAEFLFDGKAKAAFQIKIVDYLHHLSTEFTWLKGLVLKIQSKNTFPHSAGIASSASSMSALALCLTSIERAVCQQNMEDLAFLKQASHYARLGSGSAARSVFPYASIWGHVDDYSDSSSMNAIGIANDLHEDVKSLKDYIFIVNIQEKAVSSTKGHQLMNHHPYREGRIKQANDNIKKLIPALKTADWNTITSVSEEEAFSLHGLMMSSNPSYVLLEPESLRIIQRIRHWRSKYNKPIFFSIDAGPNIHVLFPSKIKDEVKEWIRNDLNEYNENDRIIFDKTGMGPTKLV